MQRILILILGLGVSLLAGCAYRGAVYAEYTHYGLGVRSSVEAAAPIDVELGYGRGVFSLVPKRTGTSAPGEAVSMIGLNQIASVADPGAITRVPLLKVNTAFISGSAALAAVTPENTELVIAEPTMRQSAKRVNGTFMPVDGTSMTVKGTPAARLAAAFRPTARFVIPEQQQAQHLIDQIDARPDPQAAYRVAGQAVSAEFTQLFQARLQQNISPRTAFIVAKNQYVTALQDSSPRWQQIIAALQLALQR